MAMKLVETSLVELSGRGFKKFLREYTKTPLRGLLSGTFATSILQSSSVVTLMVLSFVGAGVIEMKSALGVVIGSNLGTTFTGWIVTTLGFKLDVQALSFPLLGAGALLYTLLPKEKKISQFFLFISSLGLLLLGLEFMKQAMSALATSFDISSIHGSGILIHFVFGFIFTAIIQSSSATMMTTLAALNAGIVTLPGAAAIVIGADLGTTITALLGGLGGSPAKKQTALAHFSFNFVTDIGALIFIKPLLYFVTTLISSKEPLFALVFFHSTFNFIGLLAFFPFLKTFARLLETYVGNKNHQLTTHIQKVNPHQTEAALEALNKETRILVKDAQKCNLQALDLLQLNRPFATTYDEMKAKISEVLSYILTVQSQSANEEDAKRLNQLLKSVEYLSRSIKSAKDIYHNIIQLSDSARSENGEFLTALQQSIRLRNETLNNVLGYESPSHIFEDLVDLRKLNNSEYENLQKSIFQLFSGNQLSESEIVSLLNVNREVHSSLEFYLLALKEILLSPEKAEEV